MYHLKSTPEKQKHKRKLVQDRGIFSRLFFFFRTELNTHSLLKKQQVVHLLSNGNSGARRQTSAVDKFCVQYAQQNRGRVGAFKNSDFFFFLTHNSLYQSKVCSSRSSVSSVNSCLVTENTTFKSNLTSCGF